MRCPLAISERTRKAVLAALFVAVIGTGVPAMDIHAHDDAGYGHSHDGHHHSHELHAEPAGVDAENPESADAGTLHAHADGCVSLGLTSSVDREITLPPSGRSYIPRPASRPPDKPSRPLYRPPIA
jgi:hypothetical protein